MAWSIATSELQSDGTLSFTPVRQLSEDEHDSLTSAIVELRDMLGRTTWEVLRSNYASFRVLGQELSGSSLLPPRDAVQVAITTSIVNFLTAMRMYLDHTKVELKRADKADGNIRWATWHQACSAEYDDYFAYRFLYKFRNYVQHVGLPVSAWEISSALERSDEFTARAAAGEPILNDGEDPGRVVTKITFCESPSSLISKYDRWSVAVKSDLESLATEIDLSEQIDIGMECLARVEQSYLDVCAPELTRHVQCFKAIVGDLHAYPGRPCLLKHEQQGPVPIGSPITFEIADLEIERFLQAERLVGDLLTVVDEADPRTRRNDPVTWTYDGMDPLC